jgi:hypothetical protein
MHKKHNIGKDKLKKLLGIEIDTKKTNTWEKLKKEIKENADVIFEKIKIAFVESIKTDMYELQEFNSQDNKKITDKNKKAKKHAFDDNYSDEDKSICYENENNKKRDVINFEEINKNIFVNFDGITEFFLFLYKHTQYIDDNIFAIKNIKEYFTKCVNLMMKALEIISNQQEKLLDSFHKQYYFGSFD